MRKLAFLCLAALLALAAAPPPRRPPDPPVPPIRARLLQPLQSLFTARDYPGEAALAGVQGSVEFRIIIGPDGRVSDCRILRTSGTGMFRAVTCRVLRARARYEPARDANGNAVADTDTGRVFFGFDNSHYRVPQPR